MRVSKKFICDLRTKECGDCPLGTPFTEEPVKDYGYCALKGDIYNIITLQEFRDGHYFRVNALLEAYDEYVYEDSPCFRAELAGVLDRLVYDEKRMSLEEARRIEAILDCVPDLYEEVTGIRDDGRR